MIFNKLIIKNFKKFEYVEVPLNKNINIIVGDNESGKSTILEAIELVTTGKLNGKQLIYNLSSEIFNKNVAMAYLNKIRDRKFVDPPEIEIDLFAEDISENSDFKGKNNLKAEDVPGLKLSIIFNENNSKVYKDLIENGVLNDLPIEFYKIEWKSFKEETLSSYNKICSVSMIDTSEHNYNYLIGNYINDDILSVLTEDEQKNLGMAYRTNKMTFAKEPKIADINKILTEKNFIKNRQLSLQLNDAGMNNWKKELSLSVDNIPYTLSGKGTQNIIKTNLALNKIKEKSDLILIEEPENHLSYSNMTSLINDICQYKDNKQIFIVTHSNFIANKIGLKDLILINDSNILKFDKLSEDTVDYFMKLPGYDTLRLILSKYPILVEGPSDELIVQKAYFQEYGKLPIEDGIDVISVKGLSFKRFCEIAESIKKHIRIVTDNDGDINKNIIQKYADYISSDYIKIFYNKDELQYTLEPSFVAANNYEKIAKILKYTISNESELIEKMKTNKTDWALSIFNSDENICFPEYINECIKK